MGKEKKRGKKGNTDTLMKGDFVWKKNIGVQFFLKFSKILNEIPLQLEEKNNCSEDKMIKHWYETDIFL